MILTTRVATLIQIARAKHDDIAKQLNVAIDRTYDYLADDLKLITYHRYLVDILELKVEYTHGKQSWYPIGLVMNKDPRAVSNYIISNNLGPVSNGTHRCWARLFIRSLKLTLRRLKRTSFEGFESTKFTPIPEKKQLSKVSG